MDISYWIKGLRLYYIFYKSPKIYDNVYPLKKSFIVPHGDMIHGANPCTVYRHITLATALNLDFGG